ncbi:MAG: hypothetical protein ACR2OU_04655 [Thermomicrobiales bacterium]
MAAIAKSGTPSMATALPPQNEQIPGLRAGEAIGAGDLCTIAGTGLVMRSVTTNRVHGVASAATPVGEAVTLYRNVRFGYGAALTPGATVRLSATVAGGLDDAGTDQIVGFVVDTKRIQFAGL